MPQAIPAIVAGLKATAFTIGSYAVTYGTIAKVALIAASAAYSRNQAKKAKAAFASLRDQGTTVTFSDPMAVAAWIYGECRVGGVVIFAHTTGASNKDLHQVMALCPHSLSEIGDIYFGDEALGMPWAGGSPSNVPDVSSPYYGSTRINRKVLGGSADSELVSESGGAWTTSDKLTDISSLYVKTLWNVDKFPQGLSFNISCDVKGRACFDPRDSSTAYTNNPALILRDYLVNFLGYSTAEIDDDDVIAAANICDETVTIADTTTQARYTFNGRILTDTKPADGRQMIARSMAGWCAKVGAKWRMKAGAHQTSSLSLTAADFIGPIEWINQDPISEACNAVRARWLSPEKNWQEVTTPLVRKIVTAPNITAGARCTIVSVGSTSFTAIGASSNTVGVTFTATGPGTGTGTVDPYLGEDNGVEHIRDIDLFGVTNEATALRLSRIQLEESRHGLTFSCIVPLVGMKVQAGDYVDVTMSAYGWTSKLFRVASHREVHETGEDGLFISVRLVLREVSSAIYSRTASDETTADPAPNTTLQDPRDVVAPVLGTLESDDDQLTIDSRGLVISRIKVPWACADEYVLSGGTFEIEYKLSADTDWLPAPIAPLKGSDEVAWIGPVLDGEDYDVRIRAVNGLGVHSDWDTETNHTVVGKSDPPADPTSFTVTAMAGSVLAEWVPPADLDLAGYEIFHAPTGDPIPSDPQFIVAAPAVSFVVTGLTAGEDTDFWIKAFDTSGNRSSAVGPETAAAEATTSPTLWPRGNFDADAVYYCNDDVVNLVRYSGSVWKAANPAKDGDDTWSVPGADDDWELFAVEDLVTASGLILAETGYIYDTLYVGDGSANKGRIMSYGVTGFGAGAAGFFLGFDSTTVKLFVGNPSGDRLSWNGSALSMTGTLAVGSGDSATLINATAISFGTRFNIVDQSGQTTLVFQKTAGQSSGNKGFHIQADASNTILRGGDVSNAGPFSPTWSITSTTGVGMFTKVQIGADCELERSASNEIKTTDAFWSEGTLYVGANKVGLTSPSAGLLSTTASFGAASIKIGADCEFTRLFADTIKTTDDLVAAATLYVGPHSADLTSAATGDLRTTCILRAGGVTVDNAGTLEFFARAGFATYVRGQDFQVKDSGGSVKAQVVASTGTISTVANISAGGTLSVTGLATFSGNTNTPTIYVGGTGVTDTPISRHSTGTLQLPDVRAGSIGVTGSFTVLGSPSNYIEAGTSALELTGVYLGVFNSAGSEKFFVDHSTGYVRINGVQVLATRWSGATPTTVADLWAVLQHHGLG